MNWLHNLAKDMEAASGRPLTVGSGRPAPQRTSPGRAPGGVVFEVYIDGKLALTQPIDITRVGDGIAEMAGSAGADVADAAIAEGREVELLAFDGDSGAPMFRWWSPRP